MNRRYQEEEEEEEGIPRRIMDVLITRMNGMEGIKMDMGEEVVGIEIMIRKIDMDGVVVVQEGREGVLHRGVERIEMAIEIEIETDTRVTIGTGGRIGVVTFTKLNRQDLVNNKLI